MKIRILGKFHLFIHWLSHGNWALYFISSQTGPKLMRVLMFPHTAARDAALSSGLLRALDVKRQIRNPFFKTKCPEQPLRGWPGSRDSHGLTATQLTQPAASERQPAQRARGNRVRLLGTSLPETRREPFNAPLHEGRSGVRGFRVVSIPTTSS